jgi:hypothetical protein
MEQKRTELQGENMSRDGIEREAMMLEASAARRIDEGGRPRTREEYIGAGYRVVDTAEVDSELFATPRVDGGMTVAGYSVLFADTPHVYGRRPVIRGIIESHEQGGKATLSQVRVEYLRAPFIIRCARAVFPRSKRSTELRKVTIMPIASEDASRLVADFKRRRTSELDDTPMLHSDKLNYYERLNRACDDALLRWGLEGSVA